MSNNGDNGDLNEDEGVQQYEATLKQSMNLSLKDHLDKLEGNVENLLKELETSRKEVVDCEKEFSRFKSKYNANNDICDKLIKNQMKKSGEIFIGLIRESRADLAFLRNQLMKTIKETAMLEEEVENLDGRIGKNEEMIGFKYQFDDDDDLQQLMTRQEESSL